MVKGRLSSWVLTGEVRFPEVRYSLSHLVKSSPLLAEVAIAFSKPPLGVLQLPSLPGAPPLYCPGSVCLTRLQTRLGTEGQIPWRAEEHFGLETLERGTRG